MPNCAYHGNGLQEKYLKGLLGQLVQPERAAAEIEDIVVCRHLRFEIAGHGIETLFALFFRYQETRLAHDPQMLRNVVLGGVQPL